MNTAIHCRAFARYVDQVARARAWLEDTLATAGHIPDDARATAVLLLSEAVTNAVLHTTSRTITVRVELSPGRLRVEAQDEGTGATKPHVVQADPDAEHGRGLRIMSAFAHEWGCLDHSPGLYYVIAFTPGKAAP
ncbi:ATP-binding protein [Streptomonospora nanhaiensis]|uniref:Anti-sigma regulatory factor (Ser/Thr protein kinase) n=5 Tax=Streptomonospora nanhaiensis TaxID=1323731 RepID=A0A853BRP5_9ACTN|nr:ATP-binding protein [Streptomonospora nanhaiensis]NYI97405.1 anti-sigma regulatory factor (Ser/Thr protein kinase) [Streptomonospora nanhaiensis]NYI97716.1 anti-sigma regulatory factor (Ser/Thr protein kinase) [Streptomonospora nanhaiensis]